MEIKPSYYLIASFPKLEKMKDLRILASRLPVPPQWHNQRLKWLGEDTMPAGNAGYQGYLSPDPNVQC